MDLCFEFASQAMRRLAGAVTVVDETHGFRFFDERDLLGFVDGTENPEGRAAAAAALVGDADPAFAGGSYVIVQKYLHDLDAWNALSTEDQERAIGRSKLSDIEMPDDVKPANSHVALNTIEEPDGTERQILRANMPFGELGRGEFGTYYIAYAATPSVTELMLTHMFIGDPPGNTDRILDFSTAVTGSLFFVPSADFLDDLPDPPPPIRPARPASRARSGSAPPIPPARRRRFPGYRQLEEERTDEQPVPRARSGYRCRLGEHRGRGAPDVRAERGRPPGGGRHGPDGPTLASVGTGHLAEIQPPARMPPGSWPGCAAHSSSSSSGCRSR